MRLLLYSHVVHTHFKGNTYAYGPYVREMNLWLQEFDSVTIIAPCTHSGVLSPIDDQLVCNHIDYINLYSFSTNGIGAFLQSILVVPLNSFIIFFSMFLSGHVHIRCPGNIGLLAIFIQMFFPWKWKSFKYAGNWIENKGQPISYRIQKWIMANCFLSCKSKALVYGNQQSEKKCVTNAFTATYSEKDKHPIVVRVLNRSQTIHLVFAGALISGKNPFVAIDACRLLNENGLDVILTICGTGPLNEIVSKYIHEHGLDNKVICKGGLNRRELDLIYQSSHFLIMPSHSEGWPKSVAEAMWWGALPVVSPVSCVPEMLDYGNRGILVTPVASKMAAAIISLVDHQEQYQLMCTRAIEWSRGYTLESFHRLIKSVIFR